MCLPRQAWVELLRVFLCLAPQRVFKEASLAFAFACFAFLPFLSRIQWLVPDCCGSNSSSGSRRPCFSPNRCQRIFAFLCSGFECAKSHDNLSASANLLPVVYHGFLNRCAVSPTY